MVKSTLSSKGQVTIPVQVRRALGLRPGDRVGYRIHGDKAEIVAIKGSILDAAGSVSPVRRPEDFGEVRRAAKKAVGRRAAAERG